MATMQEAREHSAARTQERLFWYNRGNCPPLGPVSLPALSFLAKDDSAEIARDRHETAARIVELRLIRAGREALSAIDRAESFDNWMRIGRALVVGKQFALRTVGANAPWGRTYSRVFGEWMHQHGFASLCPSARSHAVELAEHAAEITRWRDSLPERERRRLIHPMSVTRRWRAATSSSGGRPPAELRRDALAAWKRFCACADMLPPDQAVALWLAVRERSVLTLSRGSRRVIVQKLFLDAHSFAKGYL
jgi:hypothetical protein